MKNKITFSILAFPRFVKQLIVLVVDVSLCLLTVWLAFYLRLGEFLSLTAAPLNSVYAALLIAIPTFVVFGLYRAIFRYSGLPAILTVTRAMLVYGLIYATLFTVIAFEGIPRTIGLIQPILLLLFVGASRAVASIGLGGLYQGRIKRAALPQMLIYGAGSAGRQLAAAMTNSHDMRVVGFLDDDDRLHGHVLNGLPIYNPADLAEVLSVSPINNVLLALPSVSRQRRNEILNELKILMRFFH
jgi:FlaA1/EpsC-like NDP-sugar epimerase